MAAASRMAAALALVSGAVCAAPTLTIHGPARIFEGTPIEYRAVVQQVDGTRAKVGAAWTSSSPSVAAVSPGGTVFAINVSGSASITLSAAYLHPTAGTLTATKSVTIVDASALPSMAPAIQRGWNLMGNTVWRPLSTRELFGDALNAASGVTENVISVWSWNASQGKWAFFSPRMTPLQLKAYADAHDLSVLQAIHPGRGFWIQANAPFSLPPQVGAPMSVGYWEILNGWNLLASADDITPCQLNKDAGLLPPSPEGPVPVSVESVWAWHAQKGKWLFYAPSLDPACGGPAGAGGNAPHAAAQGFLDFAAEAQKLRHGVGFWARSSASTNPASTLDAIGQAKAMMSELRTTVRAYSNDLKTGFLDTQVDRIRADTQNRVAPDLKRVRLLFKMFGQAMRLYDDVRDGNAAGYAVFPAGAGLVVAQTFSFGGAEQAICNTNTFPSSPGVTPGGLSSVTCEFVDFDDASFQFPSRSYMRHRFTLTAGATASDFNYVSTRRREDQMVIPPFTVAFTNLPGSFTGTATRGYVAGTRNLAGATINGEFAPSNPDAHKDAVTLTLARTLQNAGNGTYRHAVSGSMESRDPANAAMTLLSLAPGSYYDTREDASGNALPDPLQGFHFAGLWQRGANRLTGTFDMLNFTADADGVDRVPASMVFEGSLEDLSPAGAGLFLFGRLTIDLPNTATYHPNQPESSSNYRQLVTGFTGKILAPNRPEMRLVAGTNRTGVNTHAVSATYTYGSISVTGAGVLNTDNSDSSTLTLTNQEGIVLTFQPHADAILSKGGATVGMIPYGSAIVYFTDGYFESF